MALHLFNAKNCPAVRLKIILQRKFLRRKEKKRKKRKEVTDTVAHWVKQGYAAGPFKEPPCKNF
jgi:hypothetical protein